jgi:anti-anti-sigma regulatory factor
MSIDLDRSVVAVEIRGTLTLESVPIVRQALLKAFTQQPDAVIADLAGMRADSRSVLSVFPTAIQIHGLPSVPLAICAAAPELTRLFGGGILGDIPVYPTYEDALAAITAAAIRAPRRIRTRLAPTVDAPARARNIVVNACHDWAVPTITEPATLVVSELIANAVQHAGTDIDLTVTLRADYLHIRVRDSSPQPVRPPSGDLLGTPRSTHGRGLKLVDVYATGWGCNATGEGKIVWATLRARPVPSP